MIIKIKWLAKALEDLDQAVDYVAKDNPKAATRIAEVIASSVKKLPHFQHLGHPGCVEDTRELSLTSAKPPFIIIYRIKEPDIDILRILHVRMRWPVN